MRAALLLGLAGVAACSAPCRDGTLLVSLTLDGAAAAADRLAFVVTVDGKQTRSTRTLGAGVAAGTVEVDFPHGYPAGKSVTVSVDATAGGRVVGHGAASGTLPSGCGSLAVRVTGGGGGADLAGVDLAAADLAAGDLSALPGVDLARDDLAHDCGTVYVSATGSDGNSGCVPTAPKQTIAAALLVAGVSEVHVCAGSYAESVMLAAPVALRGGYGCADWQRGASFGSNGWDVGDAMHLTTLTGSGAGNSVTLANGGALLQGFTVMAPPTGNSAAAVTVTAGSAVRECHLVGGNTSGGSPTGSIGLAVTGGSPAVIANRVEGGGGSGSLGSAGILVSGGTPHLSSNLVNGGSGTATTVNGVGSAGIVLLGGGPFSGASPVEGNRVNGGSGTGGSGALAAAVGVLVENAVDALVSGSVIDGGTGHDGLVAGVLTRSSGSVSIHANKIYGGTGNAGANGVRVQSGTADLVNDMIDGGYNNNGASQVWVEGVWSLAAGTRIIHNTIVGGSVSNGSALSPPVHIINGSTNAVIENNILSGVRAGSGLLAGDCLGGATPLVASFKSNAVFSSDGFTTAILGYDGSCAGKGFATYATVAAACGEFGANAADCNADLLVGNCNAGADPSCVHVGGCATNCFSALFTAWDMSTPAGSSTLLTGNGWQLAVGDPCAVTRSSLDDSVSVPIDLYGTARPAKSISAGPSMGAHQQNGTCQ